MGDIGLVKLNLQYYGTSVFLLSLLMAVCWKQKGDMGWREKKLDWERRWQNLVASICVVFEGGL